MVEKLKEILEKVKEWWNRFTTRQKTIIVISAAVAVVAIVLVINLLNQPHYVFLLTAEDTTQSSEIKTLFDENGINYQLSDDALDYRVLEEQVSQARLLLGANAIQSTAYTIDNVTNGSFSTTESDKQKKYVVYLQGELKTDIEALDAVETAIVKLHLPENDGTLLNANQESNASVTLKLVKNASFDADNAAFLARFIATAIGNETTDNIVIMDTDGNMLFAGGTDSTASGLASTTLSVKQKAEQMVKSEVKNVLLGTSIYDNVEVAVNLAMDFSNKENTTHEYYPPEGATQGVLSHEDSYESETRNGPGDIPGTDTNSDTTYVLQDNEITYQTVEEMNKDYLPNESITKTYSTAGNIDYDKSTLSVAAIDYNVISEDDAKNRGLLDDTTWEEYKAANSERVRMELDPDMVRLAAQATGIPEMNIALVAYRENVFIDREGGIVGLTDILQIILIILILGLLAFVILRSMRVAKGEAEEQQPEELSVEQLLESQPEEEMLENIEVNEGSELKRLIEQFIEDNPEAAANLLRNWLSEDFA
ncbi:MAG: flagellar M-ring protein FliF [Lachnospiraceae bacterium]|nr:flagellar M-ring protein FliF [Lachnospiraceae bacterium]